MDVTAISTDSTTSSTAEVTAEAIAPQGGIGASLANAISDRSQILEANRSLTGQIGDLRQSLAGAESRASAAEAALATVRADSAAALTQLQADHAAEITRLQAEAAQATAAIPEKVAVAAVDTIAQLGIPEAALPAAGTGGDAKNATGDTLTLADRERLLTEKAAALVPAIAGRLGLN